MYDINFIKKAHHLKSEIVAGKWKGKSKEVLNQLNSFRDDNPHIFNIETTNNCNMKCVMCPRTSLMEREIGTMNDKEFKDLLKQIKPHSEADLNDFYDFVKDSFQVNFDQAGENSFYFDVVAKCLILHGYGEPLLDKKIVERVELANQYGIPTYFSCVPANLTLEKGLDLFEAGLTVLKVSIDDLDDDKQREIRGPKNNFEEAFATVNELIKIKKEKNYKTMIVPTMISFSTCEESRKKEHGFMKLWENKDVFAYVKSQDNRWLYEEDEELNNKSHYTKQYCEVAWSSLSIDVDGAIIPCAQDYNCEMKMGKIEGENLKEVWNGEKFNEFRRWHATGDFPKGHKCVERCDQIKLFEYLK